ncbi:hypothetical protein BDA96_07G046700 [Sorghum bicolor]|uniref:protein-serine/threonine phosphatase n=1 Tax=Sorghum bicolor TaxID=4558 RepID=A0A921QKQ5_SORBI|nr:hypothetical protein BDA96_07G046700 [Sorghum bicolor]
MRKEQDDDAADIASAAQGRGEGARMLTSATGGGDGARGRRLDSSAPSGASRPGSCSWRASTAPRRWPAAGGRWRTPCPSEAFALAEGSHGGRRDFYGVFDDHGCSHVAEACRDRMHELLAEELAVAAADVSWTAAMERSFARMVRERGCGVGEGMRRGRLTTGETIAGGHDGCVWGEGDGSREGGD